MRCVSCNHRVKRKSLKGTGGRCPGCGHPFVADPKRDGVGDVAVAKAVERISADGTVRFLPGHLGSELLRRANTQALRARKWLFSIGALLFVATLFLIWKKLFLVAWISAAGTALFITGAFLRRTTTDLTALAERFLAVNPSAASVPPSAQLLQAERGKALGGLGGAKRVIVCQQRRFAEFLIANEFALHHACPVIAGGGELVDLYPGLVDRLARGPAPAVIVLHDFTPQGMAFAREVRALPRWLGRADAGQVFDVGLDARQLDHLRPVLQPLAGEAAVRGALFRWGGAAATAVRPALLLAALARSVEDHQPLRLGRDTDEADLSEDSE